MLPNFNADLVLTAKMKRCDPSNVYNPKAGGAGGSPRNVQEGGIERRGLAKSYSRTMMSARILRLQTTEEGQAGFGAEQLKVVLNAFFKVGV